MDELTSLIARCASSASACSTIASRRPSPARTMRPYARGSSGSNESTVAAAPDDLCSATSCSSSSGVTRGASPDTTSTLRAPSTLRRAARTASPVPSGSSWTATSMPSNALAASGDTTTTSGSAPSGRTASTTQSTRRRPSNGCRCFAVEDFIRVPRPPASTTAASPSGIRSGAPGFEPGIAGPKPALRPKVRHAYAAHFRPISIASALAWMAGAPGFEPGIAGPKPAALPLGYAPPLKVSQRLRDAARRGKLCAFRVREEIDESDDRKDSDKDDRADPDHERQDHHEDRERLRGRRDPRQLASDIPIHVAAGDDVEAEHDRDDAENRPARELGRERDDEALDDCDPERNSQPPFAQPAADARASRFDHRLAVSHFFNGTTLVP